MQSNKLNLLSGRLGIEFKTIEAMVGLYCKSHHQHKSHSVSCNECMDFLIYAHEKLDRCPYGQSKPTCNKCPIHCYKQDKRIQAKTIMRYAGPHMLLWHPVLAVRHLLAERHPVPKKIPVKASNRHRRNASL